MIRCGPVEQPASPVCARCGAPLRRELDAPSAVCTYCGAQTELGSPDRPAAGEPRARTFPIPTRHILRLSVVVGAFCVVLALVEAIMIRRSTESRVDPAPITVDHGTIQPSPSAPPRPLPRRPIAVRPGLLLFDVDDDGAEDAISVFKSDGDRFQLGALSGANGDVLWTLDDDVPLSSASAERSLWAVIGDSLFLVDSGRIVAANPKNGRPLWRGSFSGAPLDICGSDDVVGIRHADGPMSGFVRTTGLPAPVSPSSCSPATTSKSEGPNFRVVEGADAGKMSGPLRSTLDVRRALVPLVGTARVLFGAERSGGAPAVAVVAGGKLLWRDTIAATASGQTTEARLFGPGYSTVRFDRVIVPYLVKNPSPVHVAAFDIALGTRSWDVSLAGESTDAGGEVAISQDHRVFLHTGAGRLRVLDLARGTVLVDVGGP